MTLKQQTYGDGCNSPPAPPNIEAIFSCVPCVLLKHSLFPGPESVLKTGFRSNVQNVSAGTAAAFGVRDGPRPGASASVGY